MNALGMNGKLKRHGEVWHTTGAPPVDFYGVLNPEENDLQYPVGIPLSPGSITRRAVDGSSWLITATVDRTLYRRATLSRCRHLASISRTDATLRDTFGRPAAEPQTVLSDVPLVLTDRSMIADNGKDRSGIVWRLVWRTSADFDIRVADLLGTATVNGTVTDSREIVPGVLELMTLA